MVGHKVRDKNKEEPFVVPVKKPVKAKKKSFFKKAKK